MKNSLRRLRKEKGLTLREAGEKLLIPFQTLANYEKAENELPQEFIDRAAKFFGVSETEVTKEWTEFAEETPPYRTSALALDLLPTETLFALRKIFSDLFKVSHEPEATRLMHSLFALNEELKRRPDLVQHTQKKSEVPVGGLSSAEVSQLATSSSAALERVLPSAGEGSERPHGAGEPPARKEGPHAPSAPASRPPHSGHGGKVQK